MHCSLTLGPSQLLSGCFCQPWLSSQVGSGAQQAWLSRHRAVYPAQTGYSAGDQDQQRLVQRTTVGEKGRAA